MIEHKDFKAREREMRETFDPLLNINEVRKIIGCSPRFVLNLVREGRLEAYDILGRGVTRDDLCDDVQGLRMTPSSLNAYLESTRVK